MTGRVELTAPYSHSGAYATLADVVRHHLDPAGMAMAYRADDHVSPAVAATWLTDEAFMEDCMSRVSAALRPAVSLDETKLEDLVVFLLALTDPSSYDMSDVTPKAVPSGLPVDTLPTAR